MRTVTQVGREEWHDVVLEAIGHGAGVSAWIDLEGVFDCILLQSVMKLAGIRSQAVLVAYVDGNCTIAAQIAYILIQEDQRSIRCPLGENLRLRDAVAGR